MSNPRKAKGDRSERKVVEMLNAIPGVHAERVPLSGAVGGTFSGDINLSVKGWPKVAKVEVKARKAAAGWKVIKTWLGNNDMLVLKEDNKMPLAVLTWDFLEHLFSVAMIEEMPESCLPFFDEQSMGGYCD